jgi:hypothetical protein
MSNAKSIALRPSRAVPPEHGRILDRLLRDERERRVRLALSAAKAGHEAQRMLIERLAPGTRIPVPRWRPAGPISDSKQRELVTEHAAALAPLNDEMRRDGAYLQRRVREAIASFGGRTRVVGDPTAFSFNFTAARVITSSDITLSQGAGAFVTPITTSTIAGKNGARFVSFASSPVAAGINGALVHVNETCRFTFTGCPAGAVTITALLGLTGIFQIVAPGAQFQFPYTAVPSPSLNIVSTVSIVAIAPSAPPNLRVIIPFPTSASLLHRVVESPQGPVISQGFLQSFTPTTMATPSFAVVAGATITVDVTTVVQLFTLNGGSVLVDCLAGGAGLFVPGVLLRVDY